MTKFNTRTKQVQNLRNLQAKVAKIVDLLDPVCDLATDLDFYNDYEMRIHTALVTAVEELVTAKIYLERRVRGLSRRKE